MSKHEFVWCKSIYIWGNFLHDLHGFCCRQLCQGVFRPDFPFRLKDLCCFCRDPFEKRAWIWCWLWILTAQNNRKPTALMPWSQYLLSRSHLRICGGVAGDYLQDFVEFAKPKPLWESSFLQILIFHDFPPWHAKTVSTCHQLWITIPSSHTTYAEDKHSLHFEGLTKR